MLSSSLMWREQGYRINWSRGKVKPANNQGGEELGNGRGASQSMQPQATFGYCVVKGVDQSRGTQDFVVAEFREVGLEEVGMFGVFDSHGGGVVGQHLKTKLFNNILREGGIWLDPAGATRDGYLLTDRHILARNGAREGGSTAVTAMLLQHGSRLVVANVGDCKAVLCKGGKAVQLSVDHTAASPTERANVEMRGGTILNIPGEIPLVDGQLAVTRAFGDTGLKPHISAKPDVCDYLVDLSCEFLIMGSNGLWACFSNEEAVAFVRNLVDNPFQAAINLVHEARNRGSGDDISCIIITFNEL